MKKITFLLFFLTVSFGYAQLLPFDFSDPLDLMTGVDCVATIEDDGGNDVLQIVGGGGQWDNAQINFEKNIDLSDDNNNTITFRFKNTVNDGVHTHVLKFEAGTTGDVEMPFTTEDDQWKNISIDFDPGLGNYQRMVIFTDFDSALSGTYLVDDIAGATHLAENPVFEFPVDFSDPFNDAMSGVDCTTSFEVDAGNDVLQIIGGGGQWDNAQAIFANPIDLSDTAENTITFRMRSTTATGTNEHLLKFEGGSNGAIGDPEITFTTTGTAWSNFSLDMDNRINAATTTLGTYSKIVIMTDWGGGPSVAEAQTYFLDDLSFTANNACAYATPILLDGSTANVSNVGATDSGISASCDSGIISDVWYSFEGTATGEVYFNTTAPNLSVFADCAGTTELACNPGNNTAVTGLAMGTTYYVRINDDGTARLAPGTFTLTASDASLGVNDFELVGLKVSPNPTNNAWSISTKDQVINTVKVFDVLGKQVLSLEPRSNNLSIDASTLPKGLYFAKMTTDLGSNSIKLIKN